MNSAAPLAIVEPVPSPQKWRTVRRGRGIAAIGVACAAVLAPVLVSVAPAATAGSVRAVVASVPREKLLPAKMDVPQQYQGQSICSPTAKPGITKLSSLLRATYGPRTMYSTRACKDDPTSEHTEGRALDWMVSLRVPDQRVQAEAFLNWLLAPGPDGTKAAMARRMGIMYIGWNNQIWRGYNKVGWGELKGCFSKSKASKQYDTFCHRDHVHFSMTWDGAAAITSYWDGTTQSTPPCATSRTSGKPPALPAARRVVNLPSEKVVINTATGTGNNKRICRIQEPRWSGDAQRLDAKVAGKAGVPTNAKRALVRITAAAPNAPMKVFLWATGGKRPAKATLTTLQNQDGSALVWVPVGAKGFVSVATNTGDTYIRLGVVGYEVAA